MPPFFSDIAKRIIMCVRHIFADKRVGWAIRMKNTPARVRQGKGSGTIVGSSLLMK
jgi:hypothetical protein